MTNTFFLNEGKVKFLQINQDAVGQKCFQKHSADAYLNKRPHILSPYAQLHGFWMTPHPPPVAYVLNW